MFRRLPILLLLVVGLALSGLGLQLSDGATKPKPVPAKVVRHDKLPLKAGSSGPNVVKLQTLLAGKGNVFDKVAPVWKNKPNGLYGDKTAAAVYALKYRLGYPSKDNVHGHTTAGADFFNLLEGKSKRTLQMVALAQRRLQAVEAGMSVTAFSIKQIELSQLGAHESPAHSNCGPVIDVYFRYFGIGCGLPWCEIFQQWAFASAGVKPPFANRSFFVEYTADWARQHGYLSAKARPGSLVAFLDDGGHIGYVVKVMAAGYVTIEGNSTDMVHEVYHPWNLRLRVFINIPGVA